MPEINDEVAGRRVLVQPPVLNYNGREESGMRQNIVDTYFDYQLTKVIPLNHDLVVANTGPHFLSHFGSCQISDLLLSFKKLSLVV